MAAPSSTSCLHENEIQKKLEDLAEEDSVKLLSLPQDVQDFIKKHPSLNYIGSGKVRCSLTGHEVPSRIPALESYTNGRKYQRLRELSSYDWEAYKPHIVPSKKKGHWHQLFCTLTLRHISREPADIKRHVTGKRYTEALGKYNECQALGVPFKPSCRVPRRDKTEQKSDQESRWKTNTDSEASEIETDDSMSDLYPVADFKERCEETQSDDDQENMDVDVPVPHQNGNKKTSNGQKRKNVFQNAAGKKIKKPTSVSCRVKKIKGVC